MTARGIGCGIRDLSNRHNTAFNEKKTLVRNIPTLRYYNLHLPTKTSVNKSIFGLRAAFF